MLKKEVLEAQVTIELPAREMMGVFNFANVGVAQYNVNAQGGLLNINLGQANNSAVVVVQD